MAKKTGNTAIAKLDQKTSLVNMAAQSLIASDVQIDKNDIIAIGLSRAEDMINTEVKKLRAAEKVLEKQCNDLSDEIAEMLNVLMKTSVVEKQEKIKEMVADMFSSLKFEMNHVGPQREGNKYTHTHITLVATSEKRNGEGSLSLTTTKKHKLPAELVAKLEERDRLRKETEKTSHLAMTWKQKLTKMPSLERRYKAKLAEHRLLNTEGGQDVVTAITQHLAAEIESL